MIRIRYISTVVLGLVSATLLGQQLPQFSQFHNDGMQVNPAFVGAQRYVDLKIHQRNQWTGFGNAPMSSIISGNMLIKRHYGVGLSLFRDAYGPIRKNGVIGAYSHRLKVGEGLDLHLGISGGMFQFVMDGAKVETSTAQDPLIDYLATTKSIVPDFNAGFLLKSDAFYLGASAQHLTKSTIQAFEETGKTGGIGLEHHYYLLGGYNYVNDYTGWTVKPAVMVNYMVNNPMQIQAQFIAEYQETYELGGGIRNNDAIILFAGLKWNYEWALHYSYDFQFSKMLGSNFGSHEIILGYELWANGEYRKSIKKRYRIQSSGRRTR